MNPDKREVYRLLFHCKEALEEILEEAGDCDCLNCEDSWNIVATAASNALEGFKE